MKKLLVSCLIMSSSFIFSCKSMEFLKSTASQIPESIKIAAIPILTGLALHTTANLVHDYSMGESHCNLTLRCFLKKSLLYSVPSLIVAGASQLPIGSWPRLTSSDLFFPMKVMFGATTAATTLTGLFCYCSFSDTEFNEINKIHKGLNLTKQQTNLLDTTIVSLASQPLLYIPLGCLALSAYALGKRSSMS